jgi:Flp pilus assembly protein TadD/mono/diheme cytochrome c family protein
MKSFRPLVAAVWGVAAAGRASAAVPAFHEDIEPLVHAHCAACHRPGQQAPFGLLTYTEVAKHGREIRDVTARGFMPPWLPAPHEAGFVGERRLTDAEIDVFARWVGGGMPEGDPARAPKPPEWPGEWALGKPDLIVRMPTPYTVPATGRDVYRHFVLPVPIDGKRYVRAWEFHPHSRAAHHAFLRLDASGQARRRDALDPEPGFPGMDTPDTIRSPDGHFASWQPGAAPRRNPTGLPWLLEPGSDVVIQMHLQTLGKPEPLQAEVGFYFTDQPPTNRPVKIGLVNYAIDLASGATNVVYTDEYRTPADADLLGILPHTHYLGRRVEARAFLPGGGERSLLVIPAWDFNWQGDYTYRQPIFLPAGTRIEMRMVFDNSTANPWNPSSPPKRVRFGLNTTDEMAELWLQLLPRSQAGQAAFASANLERALRDAVAYNVERLRLDPKDGAAHVNIGRAYLGRNNRPEALAHFRSAVEVAPDLDDGHYYLGLMHRLMGENAAATAAFRKALELNPGNARAHGNLAMVEIEAGRMDAAAEHLEAAVKLDPTDALAHTTLGGIRLQQNRLDEARRLLERAAVLDPSNPEIGKALNYIRSRRQ